MEDFKPCPFCGGKVKISEYNDDTLTIGVVNQWLVLSCDGCDFFQEIEFDHDEKSKKREEIAEWFNNRPQLDEVIEALKQIKMWGLKTSNAMGKCNKPVDIAEKTLDSIKGGRENE